MLGGVLYFAAAFCFLLAVFHAPVPVDLIALGLFFVACGLIAGLESVRTRIHM